MNILDKSKWFITNSENGSFNNLTNEDWDKIESEYIQLVDNTTDGTMIEAGLDLDIHYVIPYPVRLSMHKRLVELEPNNTSAIRKYALYLFAFGDPPDEIVAQEMLKRIGE